MLSRVAESLYWMSRSLERAENTARLLDVNLVLMLDQPSGGANRRWVRLFRSLAVAPPEEKIEDARLVAERLTFDLDEPSSVASLLAAARDNARQVRQQLSTETWEQLNRLYLRVSRARTDDVWRAEPHEFFRGVQDGAHLVSGVSEATMTHGEGWQFMRLGRFLERGAATAALLEANVEQLATPGEPGVNDYLGWIGLLKSRTAFEAYCQAFTADLRPDRIAGFLLLDPEFPRSARYAAAAVQESLAAIAASTGSRRSAHVERAAGRLRASLDYAHVDEIVASGMRDYVRDLQTLGAQVHAAIEECYFAPPLETVLAS